MLNVDLTAANGNVKEVKKKLKRWLGECSGLKNLSELHVNIEREKAKETFGIRKVSQQRRFTEIKTKAQIR